MEISKSRIEVAFEGLIALDTKRYAKAREAAELENYSNEYHEKMEKVKELYGAFEAAHRQLEDLLGIRFHVGFDSCYTEDHVEVWTKEAGLNRLALEG